MIRFTLKCGECRKTLGYITLNQINESHIISGTQTEDNGDMPICCPTCEVERLTKEMSNAGLS